MAGTNQDAYPMLFPKSSLYFSTVICLVLLTACQPTSTNSLEAIPEIKNLAIPFEAKANTTATYSETIRFYQELAAASPQLELRAYGSTDSGQPLHLAIVSKDGVFDAVKLQEQGKQVLMINNAIHPGEPCGVDATMLFLRDYLSQPELQAFLEHTVIIAIPFYNIGGGLNRSSTSRANQNGPEAYGFRGNARNLDLNRDFIKCDSYNARTFNQIFSEWQPEVFVDNHTSNGADYQYTLTLIPTQHNKLNQHLAKYLNERMLPRLFEDMAARQWEMTPYVYARNTPDDGIAGFLDLPRYSSGYAALFNCLSFMPETHMLKPFEDRVQSVYQFMDAMLRLMHEDRDQIAAARRAAIEQTQSQPRFALNWQLDSEKTDSINFKGYAASYKASAISGLDRLYYDRTAPYEKVIPFYNHYKTSLEVDKPQAYIIPQAYREVIERLQWNGIQMTRLERDTVLAVTLYRIEDFKTRNAYEGHYLHYQTTMESEQHNWQYRAGDYVVPTNQAGNRYIIETLEPQAPDSYFSWNFFDGILMQKEYFSAYVFEDLAAGYLSEHPELAAELEAKKMADPDFAQSSSAQLNFVYRRSPWYEPTHRIYPVGRLEP